MDQPRLIAKRVKFNQNCHATRDSVLESLHLGAIKMAFSNEHPNICNKISTVSDKLQIIKKSMSSLLLFIVNFRLKFFPK